MCTVTFLPLKGENDFVLTSNRDESPKRAAIELISHQGLMFPREPLAGGTWICAHESKRLVCLLNGAFVKHQHRPPYRKSRGLVVLDFFKYENAEKFSLLYNFSGVEPFTMVIWENNNLYELRWDEEMVHFQSLDVQQAHIWSSCPLYSPDIQAQRAAWFAEFLATQPHTAADVLDFHKNAGAGDTENALVMKRADGRQTISQTQIIYKADISQFEMNYYDFIHQSTQNAQLQL
jgi:Transport and Golgi organisation 2